MLSSLQRHQREPGVVESSLRAIARMCLGSKSVNMALVSESNAGTLVMEVMKAFDVRIAAYRKILQEACASIASMSSLPVARRQFFRMRATESVFDVMAATTVADFLS